MRQSSRHEGHYCIASGWNRLSEEYMQMSLATIRAFPGISLHEGHGRRLRDLLHGLAKEVNRKKHYFFITDEAQKLPSTALTKEHGLTNAIFRLDEQQKLSATKEPNHLEGVCILSRTMEFTDGQCTISETCFVLLYCFVLFVLPFTSLSQSV